MGWSTIGNLTCPHYEKYTQAFRLQNGNKMSWFDCHRRFLQANHPCRKHKNKFKRNHVEKESYPPTKNVMDVKAKTKDNLVARKDLKLYYRKRKGIKEE
uniref:Uncharacterized protein n=1 Tax=Lactuca sativa TaxID=4236 RepID=A0A9R1XY71_LACSA|nr:hypothetical protein LSAT_V11C100034750 [Lactuca sativa]